MENFVILTDTASDLPREYVEKNGIEIISLSYILGTVTYGWENPLDDHEFYNLMREGSLPTTAQVTVDDAYNVYKKLLEKYDGILVMAFSSGLSGSYNSMAVAARHLREEGEAKPVRVVDTKAASLGQGLMVHYAVNMKNEGKSLNEIADYMEDNFNHFCHLFTVNDLFHLHRGGRVSRATAIVGTLANIKPVLHVDDEGHLINISKVRGRKKSLTALVDRMEEKIGKYRDEKQIIFISHGDCPEDAEFVKEEVKRRFGYEDYLIHYVGPTIGAHTGPGVVALFFFGENR